MRYPSGHDTTATKPEAVLNSGAAPATSASTSTSATEPVRLDTSIIPMIVSGKWEDVLLRLTHDMDPWDVDLIELNRRFTSYIQEMQRLDLRVPAKILLTAAIIYRMKAETLNVQEMIEQVEEEIAAKAPHPLKGVKLPEIQLPLKREPRRKVTIFELISALDKAMVIKDKREARRVFNIDLHGLVDGRDISDHIDDLYEKILNILEAARKEVITFSQLLKPAANRDEKLVSFYSLLHLVHQERVACWQERLFEEIFIKAVNGNGTATVTGAAREKDENAKKVKEGGHSA